MQYTCTTTQYCLNNVLMYLSHLMLIGSFVVILTQSATYPASVIMNLTQNDHFIISKYAFFYKTVKNVIIILIVLSGNGIYN